MVDEPCSWCGVRVAQDDGFRASEPASARAAVFCRLEHVVPWVIRGAHWSVIDAGSPVAAASDPQACSLCSQPAGEAPVLLVRHRAEHRIADAFCTVEHLLDWAKRGGRYA